MRHERRNGLLLLLLLLGMGGRALATATGSITIHPPPTGGSGSGTLIVTIAGYTETVTYGPYSTASSIASALGGMFSEDYAISGLCANAVGHVLNYKLKGTATTLPPPTITNALGSSSPQSALLYSYTVPAGGYYGNGNVKAYNDTVMGNWDFTNGYDTLNRLTSGSASTGPYAGQYGCWSYDPFGNRTMETITTTQCGNSPAPTVQAQYNDPNNRISETNLMASGDGYDGAGNVTNDGANQYLYDGEGRVCATQRGLVSGGVQRTGYIYDAEGNRVAKGSLTSFSCDLTQNNFTVTTQYIVGQNGEQITAVDGSGNWKRSNVYAAGAPLATYDAAGLHFNLSDALGTKRVQVNATGVVEQSCQSLPFGDQLSCSGADDNKLHFTAKQRDTESGNDYFGARYYGSNGGRFISPDFGGPMPDSPDPVPWADFENPQSLNLYSYVQNNPLTNTDPDGNDCVTQTRTSDTSESVSVSTGNCSGNVGDGQKQTYVSGTVTGVQAGSDGHSIDIGSTNADGSTGVTNTGAASIPNNPGIAFGYNQGGYNTLGTAGATVGSAQGVAGFYGASALGGALGAGFAAGAELTTLGDIGLTPTPGEIASAERVLAQGGRQSVERAIRTLSKRLAEHQAKVGSLEGNPGSVYKEIGNFSRQIEALKSVLK